MNTQANQDAFDREIELTRHNRELMALLDRRARQPERIPLAEAKVLLGLEKKPVTR